MLLSTKSLKTLVSGKADLLKLPLNFMRPVGASTSSLVAAASIFACCMCGVAHEYDGRNSAAIMKQYKPSWRRVAVCCSPDRLGLASAQYIRTCSFAPIALQRALLWMYQISVRMHCVHIPFTVMRAISSSSSSWPPVPAMSSSLRTIAFIPLKKTACNSLANICKQS